MLRRQCGVPLSSLRCRHLQLTLALPLSPPLLPPLLWPQRRLRLRLSPPHRLYLWHRTANRYACGAAAQCMTFVWLLV
jgi:hypothetical protein